MYQKLLLTNDGSDLAEAAATRAAALARVMGSQVLVMRVSRAAGDDVDSLAPETWDALMAQGAQEVPGEAREEAYPPLSDTAALLRGAGVQQVGSLVLKGDAADVIVQAATRLGCDAIVVSSHGESGLRRAVIGSVADHVIRHSPGIPVLVARPHHAPADSNYGRLLVALDGSELADGLVPHAAALASASGAEVVLVRVTDSVFELLTMTTPAGYPVPATVTPEMAEEIMTAQRADAEADLAAVAAELQAAGVTSVVEHVIEGPPGGAIVALAADLDCDLVLLATHGRGGLGRALLGSVTDYVVRHLAGTAALVVPPSR